METFKVKANKELTKRWQNLVDLIKKESEIVRNDGVVPLNELSAFRIKALRLCTVMENIIGDTVEYVRQSEEIEQSRDTPKT